MNIILASASERRQELLKRITTDFIVKVSNFDEEKVKFEGNIDEYVKKIAFGKAKEVLDNINEDSIIISADTIVTYDGIILGKPKDSDDAFRMLKMLSGKTHKVYSGVCIYNKGTGIYVNESFSTEVTFSEISDEEIRKYIATGEPLDKAGAYGIQGKGGVFVEKINGCYYNVVGLPINAVKRMLENVK